MDRSCRSSLWLVAVAVLACASVAGAQHVRIGTLAGTVVSMHGRPVADASVTIQTSDGEHPHATHTDANGRFAFARFEIGQYDLRAYSNGKFSEWDKRVLIRTNKTTEVTLRLEAPEN
jgi:uncharacterized GH25 family protein